MAFSALANFFKHKYEKIKENNEILEEIKKPEKFKYYANYEICDFINFFYSAINCNLSEDQLKEFIQRYKFNFASQRCHITFNSRCKSLIEFLINYLIFDFHDKYPQTLKYLLENVSLETPQIYEPIFTNILENGDIYTIQFAYDILGNKLCKTYADSGGITAIASNPKITYSDFKWLLDTYDFSIEDHKDKLGVCCLFFENLFKTNRATVLFLAYAIKKVESFSYNIKNRKYFIVQVLCEYGKFELLPFLSDMGVDMSDLHEYASEEELEMCEKYYGYCANTKRETPKTLKFD